MRKQIFRQGVQKFRRQAGACQGVYVRNGGKYASILCAEPSGVLCAVLLQNKKVLKVSLRPSGRVNHAVPPEFRAFALHLTESSNSFFCNGKNPVCAYAAEIRLQRAAAGCIRLQAGCPLPPAGALWIRAWAQATSSRSSPFESVRRRPMSAAEFKKHYMRRKAVCQYPNRLLGKEIAQTGFCACSQIVHRKISTHLLTVLTIRV